MRWSSTLGYTTKLIDFDNAYLAGEPPPPTEMAVAAALGGLLLAAR